MGKKGESLQSELSLVKEAKGLTMGSTSRPLLVDQGHEDHSFIRKVSLPNDGEKNMIVIMDGKKGLRTKHGLRKRINLDKEVRTKTCPSLFGGKIPTIHAFTCITKKTASSHPVGSVTAILTAILFYYLCLVRRRRRNLLGRLGANWRASGDYAQVAVYDELLDDFDRDDLSSYMNEGDDDSIGTIISEWSQGREGLTTIEMGSLDDDEIALEETNG